jgi:hypothetical protein
MGNEITYLLEAFNDSFLTLFPSMLRHNTCFGYR